MNILKGKSASSFLFVIGILITLSLACKIPNVEKKSDNSAANTENVNRANPNARQAITETEDFKKLNPSEHLAEAKKLYNNKPSDFDLYIASLHIDAIPETAPEYVEAQAILKEIRKTADSQGKQKLADAAALQVVSSSWRKGAFGAAGIWTVTFMNKSDKPIGDVEYQTRYYSETGNDLGGTGGIFTSGEVQKIIPPKQKRTVKINDGFINKEADSATFKVTGWRFIE